MGAFGVVVIGRNEGARLRACFGSLRAAGKFPIVYVDSGSTDASLDIAQEFDVHGLSLDMSSPFSAARARNFGAKYLQKKFLGLQFVQFVDGDCVIDGGWLNAATAYLDANQQCAAVVGHLKELFPQASIYNRLCSLEWRSRAGVITDFGGFGGISMVRMAIFTQLDGFREDVIAGEDSEFAVRTFLAGHEIHKLDAPMAQHDANIHSFFQWWQRAKRSGHAMAQRFSLNGKTQVQDCRKELKSVAVWAILVPLLAISISGLALFYGVLFLVAAYSYLSFRIFSYRHRLGDSLSDSLIYSFFNVLGKFAQVQGIFKFCRNYLRKRYEIIEYK